ncbi:uncharacterized protein LOC126260731 [Schistocerca nitens]|uniref:uncharacterized protein LOC126260731 n=1 Tax=Schistocerca nitens TaxID=7011 RepID=UPI002117816F|nr:uncharacterized protein LOC126260731 [Schistocerca nitens]XP_049814035.1 uncharacterized protein LOC126260731 [Schistocerca nitens]
MIRFSIIFLLLCMCMILSVECQAWNSKLNRQGFRGYYGDRGFEETTQTPKRNNNHNNNNNVAAKPKMRAGVGLGAWGIIAIVLAIIFAAVGLYYVILFYPILCKEERKYNVIELDAV